MVICGSGAITNKPHLKIKYQAFSVKFMEKIENDNDGKISL